jgi:hypothetical protein
LIARLATFVVILATCVASARAQQRVVIATFTAEWLFDGVADNPRSPRRGQPEVAAAHLRDVADVIRAINADIVNLVEVEDLAVLERLNTEFLGDMGYTAHLVNGTDSYTGQDVGLLTRIAPDRPPARTDERVAHPIPGSTIDAAYSGETGVSKHYYTTFALGGIRVVLIGVHLLARPTDRQRALQRQAQAEVIRGLARREGLARGYLARRLSWFLRRLS